MAHQPWFVLQHFRGSSASSRVGETTPAPVEEQSTFLPSVLPLIPDFFFPTTKQEHPGGRECEGQVLHLLSAKLLGSWAHETKTTPAPLPHGLECFLALHPKLAAEHVIYLQNAA